MPDAWDILYGNSTVPTGDAWTHLNNQDGQGGPGGDIYIVEAAEAVTGQLATVQATVQLHAIEAYADLSAVDGDVELTDIDTRGELTTNG